MDVGLELFNTYHIECRDADGNLKWADDIHNLVVDVGLNDVLGKYLKGSAYTAVFYVGLTNATPVFAAANTMASHAGWTVYTNYSEATRPLLVLGAVGTKTVDSSGAPAVFTISGAGGSVGGAFITTNNVKGGATGTLYGGGAFAEGNRSVVLGDTVSVAVTFTISSS